MVPMNRNPQSFFPHFEWKEMDNFDIVNFVENENLPKGNKKISVNRLDDYSLKAILQFNDFDFLNKLNSLGQPGSLFRTFNIDGFDEFKRPCMLENAYIPIADLGDAENGYSSTATVVFGGFRLSAESKDKPMYQMEWCLNGPRDYVFTSRTKRTVLTNYIRERFASKDKESFDSVKLERQSGEFAINCIPVKLGDIQFIIGKVPDKVGPSWSSNVAIEYRSEWGEIPSPARREEILEFCSFVLG